MVTRRSSSSELRSPALNNKSNQNPSLVPHIFTLFPRSPLVEINIGLLADQVGVATTNTLDFSQSIHDLALSVNIGIQETENVL